MRTRRKKRMGKRRNPVEKRILREIEEEVRVHPGYADLQHLFALALMAGGEMEKAESHFLEALHLNRRYREAMVNLGFLNIEMGRLKEAEEIFLAEAKRHPRDGFLQHILGILCLKTRRLKEGAARIHKAIRYHSYYRDYYKKRGVWLRGKVHLDPKAEPLKEIHFSHPYAQCHNLIGLYLAKKGKFTQAVKELRRASGLKPDDFILHANLGTVYYYRGAYLKAIDQFERALKIDPFYGMGYANLSYVYGLMCRTGEALRYMRKAVQIHPQYADLHYNLALLYSDRKRYKEAASELKKALRINPNYLFARINLGVLYEDQKKWNEARREYRKVLQVTPDDNHVRNRLKRISSLRRK
ncbi:MAG: tetratricopeptide repeat protein [Thermodesulfobacteriota bacterium]